MTHVDLTGTHANGMSAVIDGNDYPVVSEHRWTPLIQSNTTYARARIKDCTGQWRTVLMHRLILNAPEDMDVDHINGNGLDNRRSNLRVCTTAENVRRSIPVRSGTSCYKGVSWHKRVNRWQAQIKVDGRKIYLGYYESEIDAARAYDQAAALHFGEFARTNFGGGEQS